MRPDVGFGSGVRFNDGRSALQVPGWSLESIVYLQRVQSSGPRILPSTPAFLTPLLTQDLERTTSRTWTIAWT